jgi:hypothetical protein
MLLEAQKKKITEFQSMRKGELVEVEKLKNEIKQEKEDKRQKKATELGNAQKVIKENEQERLIRMKEKEQ